MVPEVVALLLSFVAFVSLVVLYSHMFSGTLYLVTSVFKDTFNMMNTCYIHINIIVLDVPYANSKNFSDIIHQLFSQN